MCPAQEMKNFTVREYFIEYRCKTIDNILYSCIIAVTYFDIWNILYLEMNEDYV